MLGKTISHYEVIEKIGQGGMGEVYRATDTKLNRDVALKILPEQFASDSQRMGRFEREAKLLASLNHPNIAAIYGFEHSDDMHFLVLELVPGETLQERVAKGPLPVEEAMEVCRQIAEGVEAAHEKGVIHRDLKPANVKVTPEGKVKILDFGLAKAFEAEPPVTDISQSPTLTEEMTRAGVILGTAAYMSPEQAKGKPVDKRADIFAFGAVLYELLTGRRAFEGETVTDTLASILARDPEWEALPETTPWRIQELLRRCLEKDPHDRLHDVADVRIEVKQALSEPFETTTRQVKGRVAHSRWQPIPLALVSLVTGAVLTALVVWNMEPQIASRLSSRYHLSPLPATRLGGAGAGNYLTLSSDGKHLVYIAVSSNGRQLYLQPMDSFEAIPLEGTVGANHPFLSPDGRWVGFFAEGKLKKVLLAGGSTVTISDVGVNRRGATWVSDDKIVLGSIDTGLMQVSASGGTPEILTTVEEAEESHRWPEMLPGGKALLFTIIRSQTWRIGVLSLETGEQRALLDEEGYNARYSPSGHIIYVRGRTLMAVPFDVQELRIVGAPVPIIDNILVRGAGAADFAFSSEGSLVYISGSDFEGDALVWVDREGQSSPVMETVRPFDNPRFSPDGKRLAVGIDDTGDDSIWIYDIATGIFAPLTLEGSNDFPVWTPDGEQLTFASDSTGSWNAFWRSADGSGEAEQLTTSSASVYPTSWSLDGVLAYSQMAVSQSDILTMSLEGDRAPQSFLATRFSERHARFSPDGKWIAFSSDRSGRDEVYVTQFPSGGGIIPISTNGGSQPVWAPNGEELFYRNEDKLMVVSVQKEPTFQIKATRVLFEGPYVYFPFSTSTDYDISPDGQRFVMVRREGYALRQINVVLNWFEELKRKVPVE